MLRDPRPPVLYLRSFTDDRLRLWTATLGRPSLVERFTPRRFDRFEEVLVRHLSRYGPVIAVNPPGTRLAPLGAARETIEQANWQSAVASWMAHSGLIVFLAPPSRVTQGLHWELRTVAEHGQLDKALMVVPPVPAEQLQARWQALGAACAGLWPFTVARTLADPRALVLAFRRGRWDVATADTRTEWSYAAALDRVARRLARLAHRPAGPAGRALGTADAAGRGADRDGGRRHGGRGHLVRRGSGADGPDSGRQAFRPAARRYRPARPYGTARTSSSLTLSVAPSSAPPTSAQPSSTPPTTAADAAVLAPAAARYPGAAAIQAVMSRYFQAINGRDYAAYRATQSPGIAMTASQFQAGFGSTQDSDVLVTGITTAPGGRPAADVTFTSRQQPQDGPEGESCTNWHVTMYFDGTAGTWTIGAPPAGYRASYQTCP